VPRARCLEIGRFKGGSTFLLAAALGEGSHLLSIDNHSKLTTVYDPAALDDALRAALTKYQMVDRVELRVGDSGTVPLEAASLDLAFVDGDHTYEGVRRDFENLRRALKPQAHVLFHDAQPAGPYATVHEGVNRLITEIKEGSGRHFTMQPGAGSLAHFVRTDAPDV
jgi:predicted O-methyltransferase YrrM